MKCLECESGELIHKVVGEDGDDWYECTYCRMEFGANIVREITRLRAIAEPLEALLEDMTSIEIVRCDRDRKSIRVIVTELNHIAAVFCVDADTLAAALDAAMKAERIETDETK